MNLVIYTAIFGKFDVLKPPKNVNNDVKYICFTDKNIKCPPWEIKIVQPEYDDLRRENRKYKILSHRYFKDFQYSIYLDGNITIMSDLSKYVEKWLANNDIAVLKHPKNDCLYKEANVCMIAKLDDPEIIAKQVSRYEKEGYPRNNGLVANGFIIRRHTKNIEKFNEMWWNEVKNFSFRDQLSLCYVIYKLNMKYSIIPIPNPFNRINNEFIKIRYHGNRITYLKYLISSLKLNIKQRLKYD